MSTRTLQRVLFLQKAGVLERQQPLVVEQLAKHWPLASVHFAGDPADVPHQTFDVAISPTLPWLPQALARVECCEWVHFLSAGVDKIWHMPVDWERFALTKSSGIHGPQISEYVMGALLHFTKGFDRFVHHSRSRRWARFWLDELTGKTVMILGAGAVGEMVGRRARAFGMRVVAVKRHPKPQAWADETCSFAAARHLFPEVSALVVCLPLTDATRGIVDQAMLAALSPGAILIDVSRGGVVVSEAVIDLLDAGHLRGAALDVFEQEPLPEISRLWDRPDVLLTPHVSGTSPHYITRALEVFIENAWAWELGQPFVTPVSAELGY
jgi:phosphoglycerate dehydrogenase-like enzyme